MKSKKTSEILEVFANNHRQTQGNEYSSVPPFVKFAMPLIRNPAHGLRVENIISVQPMASPTAAINLWYMKPRSTLDGIVEQIFAEEEPEDED